MLLFIDDDICLREAVNKFEFSFLVDAGYIRENIFICINF